MKHIDLTVAFIDLLTNKRTTSPANIQTLPPTWTCLLTQTATDVFTSKQTDLAITHKGMLTNADGYIPVHRETDRPHHHTRSCLLTQTATDVSTNKQTDLAITHKGVLNNTDG